MEACIGIEEMKPFYTWVDEYIELLKKPSPTAVQDIKSLQTGCKTILLVHQHLQQFNEIVKSIEEVKKLTQTYNAFMKFPLPDNEFDRLKIVDKRDTMEKELCAKALSIKQLKEDNAKLQETITKILDTGVQIDWLNLTEDYFQPHYEEIIKLIGNLSQDIQTEMLKDRILSTWWLKQTQLQTPPIPSSAQEQESKVVKMETIETQQQPTTTTVIGEKPIEMEKNENENEKQPAVSMPRHKTKEIGYYVNSMMWGQLLWYGLVYMPWSTICFDAFLVVCFFLWCQNLNIKLNGYLNEVSVFQNIVQFSNNYLKIRPLSLKEWERYSCKIYCYLDFTSIFINRIFDGKYFHELSYIFLICLACKLFIPFMNLNVLLWIVCQGICSQSLPFYNKHFMVRFLEHGKSLITQLKYSFC